MITESVDFRRDKIVVLIGLTLFWFISSVINIMAAASGGENPLIFLLSTVGWGVGILFWCKIDAEQRGEQLSTILQIALVGFAIFALIYYLFKTRGGRGGVRSIGWMLIYGLLSYVVVVVLATVTLGILQAAGVQAIPEPPAAEAAQ